MVMQNTGCPYWPWLGAQGQPQTFHGCMRCSDKLPRWARGRCRPVVTQHVFAKHEALFESLHCCFSPTHSTAVSLMDEPQHRSSPHGPSFVLFRIAKTIVQPACQYSTPRSDTLRSGCIESTVLAFGVHILRRLPVSSVSPLQWIATTSLSRSTTSSLTMATTSSALMRGKANPRTGTTWREWVKRRR